MEQHVVEIFEGAASLGSIIGSLAFIGVLAGTLIGLGVKRAHRIKHEEEQWAALEERAAEEERIKIEMAELRQKVDQSEMQSFLVMKAILKSKCRAAIDAGWVSLDDRDDINDMNEVYRDRGGNGSMKDYVTTVFTLPNTKPEKR